jgi:hypothetical protein
MTVKMTTLSIAVTILAFLGLDALAQDVGGGFPEPSVATGAGHTLDDLGRGIRKGARRVGQKLGEIEQAVKVETALINASVAERFESVKTEVQEMPTHHRVYSRLHWDKSLHCVKIEVHMLSDGSVVLRGTVPSEAARCRALELARETVGVPLAVDQLTLSLPARPANSACAPMPGVSH